MNSRYSENIFRIKFFKKSGIPCKTFPEGWCILHCVNKVTISREELDSCKVNKLLTPFDPSLFCYVKSGGTSFFKEIKNVTIIIECCWIATARISRNLLWGLITLGEGKKNLYPQQPAGLWNVSKGNFLEVKVGVIKVHLADKVCYNFLGFYDKMTRFLISKTRAEY